MLLGQSLFFQHYGNWSVIDQADCHFRSEAARCDFDSARLEFLHEKFVQRFRLFRCRGLDETGSPSFSSIGIESELADNQDFPSDFQQLSVHLSFFIGEDTQMQAFFSQVFHFRAAISSLDSQQHQQPLTAATYFLAAHRY